MKNRYDGLLLKYNQEILSLCPYNPFLFTIGAHEIGKLYKSGDRVLEIGAGEGDSALPILTTTKIPLDLLDIAPEMITLAKKNLQDFSDRTSYICEDAYTYLQNAPAYNCIFAAWTIHNFKQEDKEMLLKAIFKNLANGGSFVLMDKVYPPTESDTLLQKQILRYKKYVPSEVKEAIITHEIEDASDAYRMDEKTFMELLKKVGFISVEIAERIERDVVLVAKK